MVLLLALSLVSQQMIWFFGCFAARIVVLSDNFGSQHTHSGDEVGVKLISKLAKELLVTCIFFRRYSRSPPPRRSGR